jgi:glutamine amidotransferase
MSDTLVLIDYGVGNLGSIVNMLKRIGVGVRVSSNPEDVRAAGRLILPGVGAFGYAMERLHALGLAAALDDRVAARVPLLGICLGMQLFSRRSEEGGAAGFGWIAADTVRFQFPSDSPQRVPHMGWNEVQLSSPGALPDGESEHRYYFAHSYHLVCDDPADTIGATTYGYAFPAIVARGNLLGVQFHPEKSHRYGLGLLRAFVTGATDPDV